MNEYDTPTKRKELVDTMTHKVFIEQVQNIWYKGKSILQEDTFLKEEELV